MVCFADVSPLAVQPFQTALQCPLQIINLWLWMPGLASQLLIMVKQLHDSQASGRSWQAAPGSGPQQSSHLKLFCPFQMIPACPRLFPCPPYIMIVTPASGSCKAREDGLVTMNSVTDETGPLGWLEHEFSGVVSWMICSLYPRAGSVSAASESKYEAAA